ncbi:hypothetical protein RCL1_004129 [Eukaryota sp. TZLM3-RCL]
MSWTNKISKWTDKLEKGIKSATKKTISTIYDVEHTTDEELNEAIARFKLIRSTVTSLEESLTNLVSSYANVTQASLNFTTTFSTCSSQLEVPRYIALSDRLSSVMTSISDYVDTNIGDKDNHVLKPLNDLTAQLLVTQAAMTRHRDTLFSYDKARAKLHKLEGQGHEVADKRYLIEIEIKQLTEILVETRSEAFVQFNNLFSSFESSIDSTIRNVVIFMSNFNSHSLKCLGSVGNTDSNTGSSNQERSLPSVSEFSVKNTPQLIPKQTEQVKPLKEPEGKKHIEVVDKVEVVEPVPVVITQKADNSESIRVVSELKIVKEDVTNEQIAQNSTVALPKQHRMVITQPVSSDNVSDSSQSVRDRIAMFNKR